MYKTTALIPFNMVLDVEVGLIRLIKYDYSQNEIFDQAILSNEDNIFFKDILSKRMNRNPLTAIATDKYIDINNESLMYKNIEDQIYEILKFNM